jgi:hypothetical protein
VIPAFAGAATQVQVRWPGQAEPMTLRLPAGARAVEVRADGSISALEDMQVQPGAFPKKAAAVSAGRQQVDH